LAPFSADHSPKGDTTEKEKLNALVDCYVAVWNEGDPDRRAQRVADLFAVNARRFNHSSEQIGRATIGEAVTRTWTRFGANGFRFRTLTGAVGHHNALKFSWEMLDGDGKRDSLGTTIVFFNSDGLIELDYQFTVEQDHDVAFR
jgi:nuclear transport factor 2 (NTF2) superfamily protein